MRCATRCSLFALLTFKEGALLQRPFLYGIYSWLTTGKRRIICERRICTAQRRAVQIVQPIVSHTLPRLVGRDIRT